MAVGLIVSAGATPSCATVQVWTIPPPATTIVPVRPDWPPLAATPKVTVPFPLPEPPLAIASHGTFVEAVHDTFAATAICRPLDAAAGTLVAVGLIVRAEPSPVPEAARVLAPLVLSEFTVTVPP